jgi:hypothetical protein
MIFERRKKLRATYEVELSIIFGGKVHTATCKNVSLDGIFVECDTQIPVSTKCLVKLPVDPYLTIDIPCVVSRTSSEGLVATYDKPDKTTINHIKTLMKSRRGGTDVFFEDCLKKIGLKGG